ncbi:hypothetical protein ABZT04_28300 [Streptomyces sp. NPDC005492]|uniref:hypothetical protein n=1 Tax=Streptomyces sp. NPDC005492 TaxID=3156883 RepID=UPI0033A16B20
MAKAAWLPPGIREQTTHHTRPRVHLFPALCNTCVTDAQLTTTLIDNLRRYFTPAEV